jgi:multidrug resistance efflux pump
MNIFNIGKANERITALEAELKTAKEKAEQLEKTAGENAAEVEKAAESIKRERDEINGKLDTEVSAHAITKQSLDKATTDLKAAQAEVAALPAKIESEGSKKAQQIMASLGQPPIQSKPSENPAASAAKTELKGLDRVKAAFVAQIKSQNG